MFKQLILVFSCLLFSCTFSIAQDQQLIEKEVAVENFTPKKSEMIYLKKTFWNVKYVKGDKSYPLGFRAKNLLKEFENCPEAKAEMVNYLKTLNALALTTRLCKKAKKTHSKFLLFHGIVVPLDF